MGGRVGREEKEERGGKEKEGIEKQKEKMERR